MTCSSLSPHSLPHHAVVREDAPTRMPRGTAPSLGLGTPGGVPCPLPSAARPRLLPGLAVLRRDGHTVQLGLDPRHAVVVADLSPGLVALLPELDGRHRVDELVARARHAGVRPDEVFHLLASLTRAGLLEDAATDPAGTGGGCPPRLAAETLTWCLRAGSPRRGAVRARADATVAVHGAGRVGSAVASLLAACGVGRVHLAADGAVTSEEVGLAYPASDVGRPRAAAVADAVRRVAPETRVAARPPQGDVDLVVLASGPVASPELVTALTARRVPHLPVSVREGVAVVGPLVFPGRSSCLRCVALHRRDADPQWPVLAAQLADRPQPADLPGAAAAAALAVGQALLALGWAYGPTRRPPSWNAVLELDPLDGVLRRRSAPPHRECGCGAFAVSA